MALFACKVGGSEGMDIKTGTATVSFSGAGFTSERDVNANLSVTLSEEPKFFAITGISSSSPYATDSMAIKSVSAPNISGGNVTMACKARQFKSTANQSVPYTFTYIYS